MVDIEKITDEEEAAKAILFSKYKEWAYEKEIRILNDEMYYQLTSPINRIIAGHRMPNALFKVLNITCHNLGITLNKIRIGKTRLLLEPVPPPEPLKKESS